MLGGIIALAAGLKDVVGHAFDPLDLAHALLLSGGVALFLAADVLFRRTLDLGPGRLRATAAALALATIPLGLSLSALAQLTALVLFLAGSLLLEAEGGQVPGASAAPVEVRPDGIDRRRRSALERRSSMRYTTR